MLIDAVSYDSWPSETWREIIRNRLESYAAMSAEDFEEMLTRQLRMTVAGTMDDDDLRAYLAPHRTALGRTSFFEHQVRHYDSRYTEELTDRLGDIAMPVRIVWGAQDRWQPVGYAERLAADIPGAELVVVPARRPLPHGGRAGAGDARGARLPVGRLTAPPAGLEPATVGLEGRCSVR